MTSKVETMTGNVVDDYFGTLVADPYRWLEDAQLAETKQWADVQNQKTAAYMAEGSVRQKVNERLSELWNYEKYNVPKKEGDAYYFFKRKGSQDQPVLYRAKNLSSDSPEIVLDPNELSDQGTVAVTNIAFNPTGNLICYALSKNGSDWQELRIRDVATGKDYSEVMKWCKFSSVAWAENGEGFYYNRYPASEEAGSYDNSVYWHTVGTEQEEDRLIFSHEDDRELAFYPVVSYDFHYLILTVARGTKNTRGVYYQPISDGDKGRFIRLLEEGEADYQFVGSAGSLFYMHTNLDAPNGRVIAIDVNRPEREGWKEVVPEREDAISFCKIVCNRLVICYLHSACYHVKVYDLQGRFETNIPLPELGSVVDISGKRDGNELFIDYHSFLHPPSVFRYNFTQSELTPVFRAEVPFDFTKYETKQVFFASKDGTSVPMFLTYKQGLSLTGKHPVLVYGYGGFNISLTPTFSPSILMWLENGGIYAHVNLRGGGEFGESWHRAGMREHKQNVFDDFCAAADWLIDHQYTAPEKIAISGGSNGGLLVSACTVQRPDLFGAVVCQVPVTDMLRYQKFTVGRFWVEEFGCAENSKEEFDVLYAYSPLHNVKRNVAYPSVLVTTADSDDRVDPAHAKKLTATLQSAQKGQRPILYREEKNAGHGIGMPISKKVETETDIYTFLFKELDLS